MVLLHHHHSHSHSAPSTTVYDSSTLGVGDPGSVVSHVGHTQGTVQSSTSANHSTVGQTIKDVFEAAATAAGLGVGGCIMYRTFKKAPAPPSREPAHIRSYDFALTTPCDNKLVHEAVFILLSTETSKNDFELHPYSPVGELGESRSAHIPAAGKTMFFGDKRKFAVQRLRGPELQLKICFKTATHKDEFVARMESELVELKEQTKRLDGESATQRAHLFSTARTVQSLYEYISRSDVIPNLKASSGPIQTFCDFSIGAENRRIPHDVRFKLDYVRNNEPSTCIHFVKREDGTVRAWVEQDEHDALTRFVAHVCGGPSNNIAQQ